MKKKVLFALLLVAIFTCLFAISISAAEPSQSDEFGEVTIIDSLSTRTDYGYSEGDTARIVLQIPDTQTYMTYPMYYCYGVINDGRYGMQPAPDFTALSEATGYNLTLPVLFVWKFQTILQPSPQTTPSLIRTQI